MREEDNEGGEGRGKQKNMNRGLLGMENGPALTMEVGGDKVGESNREKGGATVTEKQ